MLHGKIPDATYSQDTRFGIKEASGTEYTSIVRLSRVSCPWRRDFACSDSNSCHPVQVPSLAQPCQVTRPLGSCRITCIMFEMRGIGLNKIRQVPFSPQLGKVSGILDNPPYTNTAKFLPR